MSSQVTPSGAPSIVSYLEGDMALQREELQKRTNKSHADVFDPPLIPQKIQEKCLEFQRCLYQFYRTLKFNI